jgi:multidrug resistance efflux pump
MEKKIKTLSESTNSPIDGIVSAISVKEGEYVGITVPAFSILNPGKLQVRAGIKEYDIKNRFCRPGRQNYR